jgi:hypothetical protein
MPLVSSFLFCRIQVWNLNFCEKEYHSLWHWLDMLACVKCSLCRSYFDAADSC